MEIDQRCIKSEVTMAVRICGRCAKDMASLRLRTTE